MTRIAGGGIGAKNPFGPSWAKGTQGSQQVETLQRQVEGELFGRKKPPVLDVDDAVIAAIMGRLTAYKNKIARMMGDSEDEYRLLLSDDTIAMIDASGAIYVGKRFLLGQVDRVDVLVGVLAHEMGHRPKRWADYREAQPGSRDELHQLCRLEETRADYFAGRALAELGLAVEPLCSFLLAVDDTPHPEYFPAKLRADVIREGFEDARRKVNVERKLFPELAKHRSAKNDLGSG